MPRDAIVPEVPEAKSRHERDETDARLLAERTKADAELGRHAMSITSDADRVVEVARERAEEVLRETRKRADSEMAAAGVTAATHGIVAAERAAEDGNVAAERVVADERLRVEREERQRALTALLRLEREATDDGLEIERARADQAVAARDDFLAMASHDLRSLLGGIAMGAATLTKHLSPDVDRDAGMLRQVERIQRFTARMNGLVGDLVDVVSLEAGKLRVSLKPVDAGQLVTEVAALFQPSFAAKDITFLSDIAPDVALMLCDEQRIVQVLANLLSNALKFTDRGGEVRLSVKPARPGIAFSVSDTGVGIPADQVAAIFQRFRQVGERDLRGLGLGLYISKSIVEAHGGDIWAERLDRGGTALHFSLPETPGESP